DSYNLWISYLGSANACKLYQVSIFNPDSIQFDVDVTASKIVRAIKTGSSLYACFDDSVNFIGKFNASNPSGVQSYQIIPVGETEAPVDIATDGTYLYVLIPGAISGEVAKVYKYNTSLSLQSTIPLDESAGDINNATGIISDGAGNLWITTNESPAKLVKLNIASETYEMWYITDESGYN
ncbi:unnamed protein product, partial [marine sediment metagenome]